MSYEVIMGQESMKHLDLDTSTHEHKISWGEQQIAMDPRDYWMVKNQKPTGQTDESALKIPINQ